MLSLRNHMRLVRSVQADYTRLRFLGRVPLWGTGVTSVIDRTFNPDDWSARIADSRPGPGPFTNTSTVCMP